MQYRRKETVEAIQWNGSNQAEIKAFAGQFAMFDCADMDKHRPAVAFCDRQHLVKGFDVMPVHRSEVDKAEIVEDGCFDDISAKLVLGIFERLHELCADDRLACAVFSSLVRLVLSSSAMTCPFFTTEL